ncbi:MAG: thiosulfate sulfurtransferase [Alphaproteobacteria bacterium]|nr:MAG: thiosulfate sulfurtransferase [Alphaproteobacteria bacterium]
MIAPSALREIMKEGAEYALLDVREHGVHAEGHPFFAVPLPLSRLDLDAQRLLPRKSVPLYLLDQGGDLPLARRAAETLAKLGYSDVTLVDGGVEAWREAGFELFSGVNVPSKAFGEFVEETYNTPRVTAEELAARQKRGEKIVILDSRPYPEFHRMSIPGGIDMPGAELVHRVFESVSDETTQIIVNCAGRTRSIIGAQSLINAGLANPVAALKDGTMGWYLAGQKLAHREDTVAPLPAEEALQRSQSAARAVAAKFKVPEADKAMLEGFQRESGTRSLFLLDMRDEAEYLEGHMPGSQHAPGGQLVQATDEYVGVRNARLVLIDTEGVRAVMTASWLLQMGWPEVYVLKAEASDLAETGELSGPAIETSPVITPFELDAVLASGEAVAVVDIGTSLDYRAGHVPGAYWAIRARLKEDLIFIPPVGLIILTSRDGRLAHLAAEEVSAIRPEVIVRVLDGGTRAWEKASLPLESGETRLLSKTDDIWYKPYDKGDPEEVKRRMQDYLTWEVGLMKQIEREGLVRFRKAGE